MAKAVATCICKTCGNEFQVSTIKRNRSEADSWESWAAANFDECPECRKARIEAERKQAAIEAAELAKEKGLPELTGTPKQVSWAEQVRAEIIDRFQEYLAKKKARAEKLPRAKKDYEEGTRFLEWISTKSQAAWWIDNQRALYDPSLASFELEDAFKAEYIPEDVKAEKEQEAAAQTESWTLEPETKASSTVCELSVAVNAVVMRSAKDQGVIDTVKKAGMKWNSSCWEKKLDVTTGPADERLIEIGNRLLCAGYPVKCDPKYHDRIVRGEYVPQTYRWISWGMASKMLLIQTEKDNETLVRKARAITGASRYGYPVKAPVASWEEVLDFARANDFKLSPGAEQEIAAYRETILKVSPVSGADAEYSEENIADIMDSSRDVLEDLRDED